MSTALKRGLYGTFTHTQIIANFDLCESKKCEHFQNAIKLDNFLNLHSNLQCILCVNSDTENVRDFTSHHAMRAPQQLAPGARICKLRTGTKAPFYAFYCLCAIYKHALKARWLTCLACRNKFRNLYRDANFNILFMCELWQTNKDRATDFKKLCV